MYRRQRQIPTLFMWKKWTLVLKFFKVAEDRWSQPRELFNALRLITVYPERNGDLSLIAPMASCVPYRETAETPHSITTYVLVGLKQKSHHSSVSPYLSLTICQSQRSMHEMYITTELQSTAVAVNRMVASFFNSIWTEQRNVRTWKV